MKIFLSVSVWKSKLMLVHTIFSFYITTGPSDTCLHFTLFNPASSLVNLTGLNLHLLLIFIPYEYLKSPKYHILIYLCFCPTGVYIRCFMSTRCNIRTFLFSLKVFEVWTTFSSVEEKKILGNKTLSFYVKVHSNKVLLPFYSRV